MKAKWIFIVVLFVTISCNRELFVLKTNKGSNIIDRNGKIIYSTCFNVDSFHNGLAEFEDTINNLHGYIKENGKVAFISEFKNMRFSEDLAFSRLNDSAICLIDTKGKVVSVPKYQGINLQMNFTRWSYFSEGFSVLGVSINDSASHAVFINKKGNVVFNKQFVWANNFHDGLASVQLLDSTNGYIDKKGHVKIMLPTGHWGNDFSEGLAWIDDGDSCYLINKKGKKICEKKFLRPENFHNRRAMFQVEKNGAIFYGFINRKCETVIEPVYYHAFNFSDGLATMSKRVKNRYGYFDTYVFDVNGNVVLGPYRNVVIREFRKGVAPAQTQVLGDTCFTTFYITKKGKIFGESTHCYED